MSVALACYWVAGAREVRVGWLWCRCRVWQVPVQQGCGWSSMACAGGSSRRLATMLAL